MATLELLSGYHEPKNLYKNMDDTTILDQPKNRN